MSMTGGKMAETKVTIDEVEVTAKTGATILEAAEEAGFQVPTLCYIRGLMPIGGCRICVVEVEGSNKLVGSCHTPVVNGMKIKTQSAKVLRARKAVVELMLAGHTGPCVSDVRIGQCELNRIASDLEAGPPKFQVRKVRNYPIEDTGAHITRDLSRCILCGRCVRACTEIVGQDVFSTGYRGFGSKIVVDCDVVLAKDICKDCGVCAEYCPTSALTIPGISVQKKRGKVEIAKPRQSEIRVKHEELLVTLKAEQKKNGYLSDSFITKTATELKMPVSELFGVATFYSFLSVRPQGRNVIRVCGNIPCYLKESAGIVEAIKKVIGIGPGESTSDGRFSLELTNCIGACDEAPAMLVNSDLHGSLTPEKIGEILKEYN
jgi:NADH:ubiquinone oxidoreductase subunit E/Pyruvate/2-oxoacid:ferredoxin oxidoreductase delta subunit